MPPAKKPSNTQMPSSAPQKPVGGVDQFIGALRHLGISRPEKDNAGHEASHSMYSTIQGALSTAGHLPGMHGIGNIAHYMSFARQAAGSLEALHEAWKMFFGRKQHTDEDPNATIGVATFPTGGTPPQPPAPTVPPTGGGSKKTSTSIQTAPSVPAASPRPATILNAATAPATTVPAGVTPSVPPPQPARLPAQTMESGTTASPEMSRASLASLQETALPSGATSSMDAMEENTKVTDEEKALEFLRSMDLTLKAIDAKLGDEGMQGVKTAGGHISKMMAGMPSSGGAHESHDHTATKRISEMSEVIQSVAAFAKLAKLIGTLVAA